MKNVIKSAVSISAFVASFSTYGGSAEEFVSAYKRATRLNESPPEVGSLTKVCEHQAATHYTSFFGWQKNKAGLMVLTKEPITDLGKVISLRALFNPSPTARPGPRASLSWGYIFDRNRDGKVDYLMFLDGARPVALDEFPSDYPKGRDAKLSLENVRFVLNNSRLVADENFDGTVDSIVAPLTVVDRPMWVGGYGVLQSSKFNSQVDREWAFTRNIGEPTGRIPKKGTAFVMQDVDKALEGAEWLEGGTELLKVVNEAAIQCGFGPDAIMNE